MSEVHERHARAIAILQNLADQAGRAALVAREDGEAFTLRSLAADYQRSVAALREPAPAAPPVAPVNDGGWIAGFTVGAGRPPVFGEVRLRRRFEHG